MNNLSPISPHNPVFCPHRLDAAGRTGSQLSDTPVKRKRNNAGSPASNSLSSKDLEAVRKIARLSRIALSPKKLNFNRTKKRSEIPVVANDFSSLKDKVSTPHSQRVTNFLPFSPLSPESPPNVEESEFSISKRSRRALFSPIPFLPNRQAEANSKSQDNRAVRSIASTEIVTTSSLTNPKTKQITERSIASTQIVNSNSNLSSPEKKSDLRQSASSVKHLSSRGGSQGGIENSESTKQKKLGIFYHLDNFREDAYYRIEVRVYKLPSYLRGGVKMRSVDQLNDWIRFQKEKYSSEVLHEKTLEEHLLQIQLDCKLFEEGLAETIRNGS